MMSLIANGIFSVYNLVDGLQNGLETFDMGWATDGTTIMSGECGPG